MGLETGTYISDLVPTNPVFNDPESQGDDHVRLVKNVLQNTFPGANRAFPIPTSVTKSADYTILSTDQNKTIYVSTAAAARTLTLPTLTSADYGWSVTIVKATTDANPIFIVPASGTITTGEISSLSKCRRGIANTPFKCSWVEGVWIIERCVRAPLLSVIPFFGASLPSGFEWPNGTALSSSLLYPEYNSARGGLTTPDLRGRAPFGKDNMGGASSASRVTSTTFTPDGLTLEATAGAQTVTLGIGEIPAHSHGVGDPTHTHGYTDPTHSHGPGTLSTHIVVVNSGVVGSAQPLASNGGGADVGPDVGPSGATAAVGVGITISAAATGITTSNSGGGGAHNNMPPALLCNYLLIVE